VKRTAEKPIWRFRTEEEWGRRIGDLPTGVGLKGSFVLFWQTRGSLLEFISISLNMTAIWLLFWLAGKMYEVGQWRESFRKKSRRP